jgi:KaiC/GvpD/RAD55 family RecA-like ATPase
MAKQELFERSPVRAFDAATNGGLKAGEIGLVTSKKGLGKTSVLVQFGMDTLLNGKQLVHVSFDQHSENVISWYEGIFTEIAKKKSLSNADEVKDTIVRNRTILNFNQENFNLTRVVNTLNALKAGGISVAGVVIDGVDLSKVKADELQAVQAYAKTAKVAVWMSATAEGDKLEDSAPKSLKDFFAIVLHLSASAGGVKMLVVKLRDEKNVSTTLKLDSKTLLIVEK